jgi:hypothetical protein
MTAQPSATREAPTRAELRPTCAGTPRVNLPAILALLGLRNLFCAGGVAFLLVCGVCFRLFLRRLLVRSFRRFVAHNPQAKIQGERSQYGHHWISLLPMSRTGDWRHSAATSRPRASRGRTLRHRSHGPPNEIVDPKRFLKPAQRSVAPTLGSMLLHPKFPHN